MESFRSSFEHRNAAAGGGGEGKKPELGRGRQEVRGGSWWFTAAERKKATAAGKLLVNVKLGGCMGTVQVVMSSENTVHELKKAVVEIYVKEKRRPFLDCCDPHGYVLHYSQFSLEGLHAEEKLKNLGSRHFFMRQKEEDDIDSVTDFSHVVAKTPFSFVELMNFVL